MCARPPPPPTTLPPHIHQLVQSLLTRFQDLESYQIPQLAQCRGPLDFHHELAQAVRSELAGCRRDLDELKLEVDDLEKAKDRLAAADHVNQVQLRLDQCTKQYRQAVVQSKRQIDASTHLFARDELLSSGASQSGRDSPAPYSRAGMPRSSTPVPGQSADDALMSATSDVTEGLRRTLQLMQQEVDRSLVSNELLESQTQTMSLTSTQYSTFSTLLTTSKSLITSLERADVLDRLLLFGAFAFFVAVCAHIFKKRVLDRGIKVAGALAGVVEKGGRALAGGAGGKEAGEVVKREVTAEVARAAATATAVAGALKAGVTGLAERARAGRREDEQERGTEVPFEEIVQPSPAEPVSDAAAPVEEAPYPAEAEEPIPIPHEPIDPLSDEGAAISSSLDPLPAESTEIPPPPSSSSSSSTTPSPPQATAQSTVATSPAEPPSTPAPPHHDAHAEVEEHDEVLSLTPSEAATQEAEMPSPSPSSAIAAPPSDADSASAASTPTPISASPSSPSLAPISSSAPAPPAAAGSDEPVGVTPRQIHPPTPSLSPEEVDELLFETPAKPDLAEVAEAEEREEEPEHTKEADEEKEQDDAIGGIEAVEWAPEAVESEQRETEQAVPVAPEPEVVRAEASLADLPHEPTSSPSFPPSDAPASVEPSVPAPTPSQADATLEERLAPPPESTTSPLGPPEPVDDDEVPPPSPSHETSGQIASEEPLTTRGPVVGDEAASPSPPTAGESGQVEEPLPSAVELAQPEPVHKSTEEPVAEELVAEEEPLPSSHVEAALPSSAAPEEPASTIVSSSDIAEEQAADSIVDAPTPVPAEADELPPSDAVQTGSDVVEEDVVPPASAAVAEEAPEPTAQLDEIAAAPTVEPSVVVAPSSSPAPDPPVESPSPPSGSPDVASLPLESAPAAAAAAAEDEDEDDLPNSSHIYPPASVEDVPSATQEEDMDASAPGVFEEAAQEAVEGHVGEEEDGGLMRKAEERLHELEEEGGGAEEFATDGDGEAVRRDEL
ncbi:hypothetical protein JCM1840_006929 [Sporobolomyces johnsonii]